jgi:hypothetical protein
MTETVTERRAALTTHEARFVFESFDPCNCLATNTVFRYETSSALLAARFADQGIESRQGGSTPPRLRRPAVPSRSASAESGSLRP